MAEFVDDVTAKYAERIAKLLAKAESTTYQEEADSLFAKAQALMTEHSITASMIADAGGAAADILGDGAIHFTGIFQKVTMRLAFNVAANNNVKCVYRELTDYERNSKGKQVRKNSVKVTMFGFSSDIANVELLVNSLQLQCAQAMQRWAKDDPIFALASTPMEKFKEKREFIIGFSLEINDRMKKARIEGQRAAAEAAKARGVANATSSVALVVQSKEQLVSEGFNKKFPHLRNGKSGIQSRGSSASTNAGRAAGAHANLGGGSKSVSGGGKALGQ